VLRIVAVTLNPDLRGQAVKIGHLVDGSRRTVIVSSRSPGLGL
jgi:hypothetical protein